VLRDFDFAVADGAKEWLTLLNEYQVPCCVCAGATMDRGALASVLERAGLRDLCPISVTAEDGCETTEQARLRPGRPLITRLTASVLPRCSQLERPPERCVVFSDDVDDILAGHDATAKVVAVMGGARRNGADLRIADQRVSSFEDMSLMSLRELFKGEKMR